MAKTKFYSGCIIIFLSLLLLVLCGYKDEYSIDLNTCILRHRRSIFTLVLRDQLTVTDFARLLRDDPVSSPHDWRIVASYTFFRSISPHYEHHNTSYLLKEFIYITYRIPMDSSVKRDHARHIADLVKANNLHGVRVYINKLDEECTRIEANGTMEGERGHN
jgi:hypothetical protein